MSAHHSPGYVSWPVQRRCLVAVQSAVLSHCAGVPILHGVHCGHSLRLCTAARLLHLLRPLPRQLPFPLPLYRQEGQRRPGLEDRQPRRLEPIFAIFLDLLSLLSILSKSQASSLSLPHFRTPYFNLCNVLDRDLFFLSFLQILVSTRARCNYSSGGGARQRQRVLWHDTRHDCSQGQLVQAAAGSI